MLHLECIEIHFFNKVVYCVQVYIDICMHLWDLNVKNLKTLV